MSEDQGNVEVDPDQLVMFTGEGREPGQPTLDQSPDYRASDYLDQAP